MRVLFTVFAVAVALVPSLSARQQPAAEDLLKAARTYAGAYAVKVSGAVLDERYTLMEVGSGRMQTPARINSDMVFVNVNGTLVTLRDSYSVGGAKIREPELRISTLLAEPTQAKWDQAMTLSRASYKYFLSDLVLRLNDPVYALRFLAEAHASKLTFSIEGKKKMNGVDVVGLRFTENRSDDTKYIIGTRGNGAASGRFWVDPATGTIHGIELALDSKTETGVVTVTFAPVKGMDFLLPSKTVEMFEERSDSSGGRLGAGNSYMKFEASAAYGNPRYSAIDFSKAR